MPNLITRGKAIVGTLAATADLVALNALEVSSSVSLPSYGSVAAPAGGGTVDSQARTAIGSIISVLQATGLLD